MLSLLTNKATIAAGDDDLNTRRHRNDTTGNNHSKYGNSNNASDDSDTTTPDLESKQKSNMLPCMTQSLLELVISLSFSFVLKLVFGGLCGIRTLFLVHICNFVMSGLSKTEQVAGRWMLNTAVLTSGSTVALTTMEKGWSSYSRISWPPPTFIALTLFTIGTLVVHPDGYTWIVVHKIRYVLGSQKTIVHVERQS